MIRIILALLILITLIDVILHRGDAVVMAALAPSTAGNGCPAEDDLEAYGHAVIFDQTIRIEGSPQFVSRTVTALRRLVGTSGYPYAKALRRIVERHGSGAAHAWIRPGTATANVRSHAAERTCTALAGTLVHEGAHELGHGEVGAYSIQAAILRELGEPRLARAAMRQAERYAY